MASTTLFINGFSVLGESRSNTNASNGGELMIHDGTAVFEDDDIIAIVVDDVDANGILTDASVITQIIVYDNAADYYAEVPKFTYDYSGTGTGADIPDGRAGMGDAYLRFDAAELTSTDASAPALSDLVMVAGVDLVELIESGVNPIETPTFQDIDYNQNGTIDTGEVADGAFSSEINEIIPICFARGTLIETPDGPRYIETLRVGDLVTTLDNGPQPIRWIGARKFPGTGVHAPVRIKAGVLGNIRDLRISQNHRMMVRGAQAELLFGQSEVLVAAKHLVNDDTIRIVPCETIEYYHFLFDTHEIVFAECCASESLFPGPQTLRHVDDTARDEITAIFPELAHYDDGAPTSRLSLRGFEARALRRVA
ncbi:Hint domain-containing protein [Tropicibacter naphthalenivorans]|uniref:Hedgehog/Intein (Hint) domain-containing protein n=1 Tax=Tropicibacter naphthalenivorans TaxID=441103 RepID=A0A0P1GML1_9RHOB|nr:Hint domain-containing protein [Tropicibacter naphthalenivorans]CUH76592.1 hypothetical protein TRN7648_01016 [Tropicibacter naphthalenivorans]SMC64860.1 Hint domain-containing protein [Tropicibacter naphthalenivorans]